MAKKRRKPIKLKKERVILGDILPFETPIIFSNRHFYDFLVENKVELVADKISWKKDDEALNKIIKIVCGNRLNSISTNGEINSSTIKKERIVTIPFEYKISHKENSFRELNIIHPVNQIQLIEFYQKYKELILYYCDLSPFSIRKPSRVATFTTYKDKKSKEVVAHDHEHEIVEEFGKEYKNIKTFFAYKKYSNIHKFYESYMYHQAEKKYDKLLKFDISKCFDSIYTHSFTWAITNKEIVKDYVKDQILNFTFGGEFDTLMQKLNYNETNGIVIGPEFSRIFAEIILQRIDFNVSQLLRKEEIVHKRDYEVYRYVDDFFVFHNDEKTKDKIIEIFQLELKKFNLYLNENKTIPYEKPIITELTIAKNRISDLLNQNLKYKIELIDENEETERKRYSIYISSNKLITDFKTIIKETNTSYKDILNYALAIIDRRVLSLIKQYEKIPKDELKSKSKLESKFIKACLEILDLSFFLYSVTPRVNTTIKLSMILMKLIKFLKGNEAFSPESKDIVFKKVYDEISQVLAKKINKEYTQVETLYLLLILSELGRDYRLNEKTLLKYFKIEAKESGTYEYSYTLNYWSITVLLYYMKNIKRYDNLRLSLKDHIKEKFNSVNAKKINSNAELVFLLLDIIACPYLDSAFKSDLLNYFGIDSHQSQIIKKRDYWFIKWTNFNFEKELNTKKSQEVY